MSEIFHQGEIAVQKKAGVEKMAGRIGGSIRPVIHPVAQNFLRHQSFVFAASTDKDEHVWASVITGDPGFIEVPDERTVRFAAANLRDEILTENLRSNDQIGILAIEFDTRLRMRLNGRAKIKGDFVTIRAEEVFSNCQKYIQARTRERTGTAPQKTSNTESSERLSVPQKKLIAGSDTFFIASRNKERGADISHRGGFPGFIEITDDTNLIFPDYSGNMMFQTLGNIQLNPNSGLLFVDFENGHTLQLSGKAEIVWDENIYSQFAGAERAVAFRIEKIVENRHILPFRWEFQDYSPANPA